jgi:hypothetical protein
MTALPVIQNTPTAICGCGERKKTASATCLGCYRAAGIRSPERPAQVRFWEKVDMPGGPDDCWPWLAHLEANGYGRFGMAGQMRWAHRASWVLAYGPIPAGLFVCHHCDNRRCVRPSHLFLGTQADNMRDAAAKGRTTRGERDGTAKLTEQYVRSIRARYAAGGVLMRELAQEHGVSITTIRFVIRGMRWAHVA